MYWPGAAMATHGRCRYIVHALAQRLPQVPAISLDVRDIRRESFSSRRNCLED